MTHSTGSWKREIRALANKKLYYVTGASDLLIENKYVCDTNTLPNDVSQNIHIR